MKLHHHDPLANIRVILVRPSHPGNIGAAARALKTMGLSSLHLVRPRAFPHAEADARASGAVDVLQQTQVHDGLGHALERCVLAVATSTRRRDLPHETMPAREAAQRLVARAASNPVALVFGNETTGLTSKEASACQVWAHIPANPEYASLNLAAAVQVFTYELRMACGMPTSQNEREDRCATLDQVEALYAHLERAMAHTGFYDPANPKRLLQRLRRMLAHAQLEAEEVNILQGFLKSIDKMRR